MKVHQQATVGPLIRRLGQQMCLVGRQQRPSRIDWQDNGVSGNSVRAEGLWHQCAQVENRDTDVAQQRNASCSSSEARHAA
jgi:hypothetical protein